MKSTAVIVFAMLLPILALAMMQSPCPLYVGVSNDGNIFFDRFQGWIRIDATKLEGVLQQDLTARGLTADWHLHSGSSRRLIPTLFGGGLRQVDFFVHDSRNVFAVLKMELEIVWPHLAPHGAIVVNNIGRNTAFADFVKENNIESWLVIEQKAKKGDLTGVILRV